MDQDNNDGQPPALAGLALRYPEKTCYLGRVFNHTTNSYKLVWFLAILSLIKSRQNHRTFPIADILAEMALAAWHPVCLYRLSLGRQDTLQDVVHTIQRDSLLPPNASPAMIRQFLSGSTEAKGKLASFDRYVPARFLSPWFPEKLQAVLDKGARRERAINRMAAESQKTRCPSPYYFEGDTIRLNESWHSFFVENMGVVASFAEYHFALYLQSRNPNVPGVVNKLRAPVERQLSAARRFWRDTLGGFQRAGRQAEFKDIYSEEPLGENFAVDHFLPWSFVTHDLLWNLTPVAASTNSSKNDLLPDLELYLPRLAKLHFGAMEFAKERPKLLEDHTDCFKQDVPGLLALGERGFILKYQEIMLPQAQIAINQGFQSGWKMTARPEIVTEKKAGFISQPVDVVAGAVEPPTAEKNFIPEVFSGEIPPTAFHLPFYLLKVAAGLFLAGDTPNFEGWIDVGKHGFSGRLSKGMFVAQVVGASMEPTIMDGAYCVFRNPVVGSRQGRIVLAQKLDYRDPETGGNYTVKRYRSTKKVSNDGWRHESIQLIPDNPDRERFPILEFDAADDANLQIVAEYLQMLEPCP